VPPACRRASAAVTSVSDLQESGATPVRTARAGSASLRRVPAAVTAPLTRARVARRASLASVRLLRVPSATRERSARPGRVPLTSACSYTSTTPSTLYLSTSLLLPYLPPHRGKEPRTPRLGRHSSTSYALQDLEVRVCGLPQARHIPTPLPTMRSGDEVRPHPGRDRLLRTQN
jgi:hypothetical protein